MSFFESITSTVIANGFSSLIEYIRESRIDARAVNKTASHFHGVIPGGKEALHDYLKDWTDSSDFKKLIDALSKGKSKQMVLNHVFDSFLKATPIQKDKIAKQVLEYLIQTIRDELYNSREGNALQMRRIEQIKTDLQTRFDDSQDSLKKIDDKLSQYSPNVRKAINEYLTSTHGWKSIKDLLEKGRLNEAQKTVEERLGKLEELLEEYPDAKTILRDHRLDLLIKLSNVLSQLGDFHGSQKYYYQAKEIGLAKSDHINRALSILLNLTMVEEYESLFHKHKEKLQDSQSAEIDLAVLKGDWEKVIELTSKDGNKFRSSHLRIIAELERASDEEVSKKAPQIFSLLQQTADLLDNHPLHKIQISTTTINFLHRIVDNMLDAPGLDRESLIKFAKEHTENSIQACEKVNFERGISIILKHAYKLYHLLHESDRQKELEHKILNLDATIEKEKKQERNLHEGHISQAQRLYLDAVDLLDNPTGAHKEKAKRFMQTALDLSDHEIVKITIAQTLIELLIKENDPKSAREVLQQLSEIQEYNKILLEIPVIYSEQGKSHAIEYIRDVIKSFPNSIQLHRNLIDLLIEDIESKGDVPILV